MATTPRRRPDVGEFTPPPGNGLKDYPILDPHAKKKKSKMQRIIARKNMLFLFSQEVMLIPKNTINSVNDLQETDGDPEQHEPADEDPGHHEPADGGEAESIAASSDRVVSYDGQPWTKLGH